MAAKTEDRDIVRGIAAQLSRGLLQDAGHIPSNMKQAQNLFERSGLDLERFRRCMMEAQSVLVAQLPRVRNRAAYYFRVLTEAVDREAALANAGNFPTGGRQAGLTAGEAQASIDWQDQSPPPTNRGALSTSLQGIVLDWLSFTLPEEAGEDFIAAVGWDLLPLPKGFNGYADSWLIQGGDGRIAHSPGRPEMGWHVCMPAGALAQVEDPLGFLAFTVQAGGRPTRVDLAIDDKAGVLSWDKLDAALEGHVCTSRWRDFEPIVKYRATKDGMKLIAKGWNCGSRTSKAYLRFYDKALEQAVKKGTEPEGHWIRCELEAHKEGAEAVVRLLLAQDGDGLRGFIRSYLDFKIPGEDSNKTRWVSADWWVAFLGAVDKRIGLVAGAARKTLADVRKWLEKSVAPSLALILKDAGGDIGELVRLCSIGQVKLKPHHLAMLSAGAT